MDGESEDGQEFVVFKAEQWEEVKDLLGKLQDAARVDFISFPTPVTVCIEPSELCTLATERIPSAMIGSDE